MAKVFTPIQSVAAAGLLKNKGFSVSANLVSAVNGFNNSGFVTLVNSALAVNSAPEVVQALNNLPEFLTGRVGAAKQATVPEDIRPQFNFTNLISDVRTQANLVLSSGSRGLVDILPQIRAYCQTTFDLIGNFVQVQNTSFDSFGITIRNYQDILTGGVSSQFRNVAGGIESELELDNGTVINTGYAALVNQIGNFGTMYDIRNLTKLSDPRTLCQNLLDQGFYQINTALVDAGVNVSNLPNEDVRLVTQALTTIRGSDLKTILTITNFKPYRPIENLFEVFDIHKVLSPAAATAAGGSLADLSRKLTNIGGTFSSFSDVKLMYSSIQTASLTHLSGMQSMADAQIFVGAADTLGNGSGIFGNPTVPDMIGSAGGIGYTNNINEIIAVHSQLWTSPAANSLKLAIQSSITNPNNSTAAQNIVTETGNFLIANSISNLVSTGTTRFNQIFNRLLDERKNIRAADINLSLATNSVPSVVVFVSELHNAHRDPSKILYAEMLKSITDSDVFGEAIFAAIVEGHNIDQLNTRGIANYTRLDPIEYAEMLASQDPCG